MLGKGKIILFFLFLINFSCTEKNIDLNASYSNFSRTMIGSSNYGRIFSSAQDSIYHWQLNKLSHFKYCGSSKNCILDSLLCFNSDTSRFVGAVLIQQLLMEGVGDDIEFFYGERINNQWFFFTGDTYFVLRSSYPGHSIHNPLSYKQLHEAALKNIFVGYIKYSRINEAWFDSHFENIGWGNFNDQTLNLERMGLTKKFTDRRKFFEAIHLQKVKYNWAYRDTTKPIIPFPTKSLQ